MVSLAHRKIVYISCLQADSMINQAQLFKKLLEQKGYRAIFKSAIATHELHQDDVIGAIYFQLATINFLSNAIITQLLSKKPVVIYVTLEGIPTKGNVLHTNMNRCEFVAVSNFVRECLENAGLRVRRVVHHAIDWELCGKMIQQNQWQRRELENIAKDKVKFLVVARDDPRKNLKGLAEAMEILNNKGYKDKYVVFLITDDSAKTKFNNITNAVILRKFGGAPYELILGYMSASDYLIHPSFCEGFGLPILEANACGVPVIHVDAPPMNEFSSADFNFLFNYIEKQPVKANLYQYWIFHLFTPRMLAEMIAYAIDVYENCKDEYEEYRIKAREHTKDWDYKVKYLELLRELRITPLGFEMIGYDEIKEVKDELKVKRKKKRRKK